MKSACKFILLVLWHFFSFHNDKKNTNAGILPRKMKSASEKQLNYLNLHIDHREEDLRGQTKQ